MEAPSPTVQQFRFVLSTGTPVENYFAFAILAAILCLPAGIPAIVYANQVKEKLQAGELAAARIASRNAKMWCWIAVGVGLAMWAVSGMLLGIGR